jgi:hypothetical protein
MSILGRNHFPLKMPHPAICAIDMALKFIYAFGLDKEYKTYVRFEIYYLLLECVIKDPVKDFQTVKDLFEIIPYVFTEFCKQPAYATKYICNHLSKGAFISGLQELLARPKSFDKVIIRPLINPLKNIFKKSKLKNTSKNENSDLKYFENILEFGAFIDEQFMQKNNRISLQRDLQLK